MREARRARRARRRRRRARRARGSPRRSRSPRRARDLVAALGELLAEQLGEGVVGELGLLQADDVRLPLVQPRQQPRQALLDRVDVPGRDPHRTHGSRRPDGPGGPRSGGPDAIRRSSARRRRHRRATCVREGGRIVARRLARRLLGVGPRPPRGHRRPFRGGCAGVRPPATRQHAGRRGERAQRPGGAGGEHGDRRRQGHRGGADGLARAASRRRCTRSPTRATRCCCCVALTARAAARPTPSHPLGYGPERYFWALHRRHRDVRRRRGGLDLGGHPRADPAPAGARDASGSAWRVLVIALVLDGVSRLVAVRQLRKQAAAARRRRCDSCCVETADPTVVTVYLEDTDRRARRGASRSSRSSSTSVTGSGRSRRRS